MLKCSLCQRSLEDKLLQTLLQSLPGSSGNGGSSRIQALLKVSGKVGIKSSDFWFCHILPTLQWLMLPCSAQWKSSHFFVLFLLVHQGIMWSRRALGCEQPASCQSAAMDVLCLSADPEGEIEIIYWGGITAPRPRPQVCSGVDKNNEPQWIDDKPFHLVNMRLN